MTGPLTIGLTGNIGSGKSTAAEVFRQLGAEIVSGDKLGRLVLEQDIEVVKKIRDKFGSEVIDENGNIKRRDLSHQVFASRENTEWLTKLTFPGIYLRWKHALIATTKSVVVFDAALLVEWGIQEDFDVFVVVIAPIETILKRMEQRGFSKQESEARFKMQLSPETKITSSAIVIENSGSENEFQDKIKLVWKQYIQPRITS